MWGNHVGDCVKNCFEELKILREKNYGTCGGMLLNDVIAVSRIGDLCGKL